MNQRQRKHRLGTVNKDFNGKRTWVVFIHPNNFVELLGIKMPFGVRKIVQGSLRNYASEIV